MRMHAALIGELHHGCLEFPHQYFAIRPVATLKAIRL